MIRAGTRTHSAPGRGRGSGDAHGTHNKFQYSGRDQGRKESDFKTQLKNRPPDGIWLTGEPGSFDLFQRLYKQRAGVTFGIVSRELGAENEMAVNDPEESAAAPDTWQYKMDLETAKLQTRKNSDIIDNRAKMFDDLMMHISLMSEQRIRQHENFDGAETQKSAWELWNILRDTHLIRQFVGRIGVIGLRRELVLMNIGTKGIATHTRMFKQLYETLVASGDDIITPQAAADFFLTSLGVDFGTELNRWGRDNDFPDNLDDAIRRATTYIETERNTTKMMEYNSGKQKGSSPRADKDVVLIASASGDQGPPGTHMCKHCNKWSMHTAQQCYKRPGYNGTNGQTASKKTVVIADATEEKSSVVEPTTRRKSKPAWSVNILKVTKAALAKELSNKNAVIFDPGANINLWNCFDNISQVRKYITPIAISGVGSLLATHWGIHSIFGEVNISLDFWACLVSQFAVKGSMNVQFISELDYYSLEHTGGSEYKFFCNNVGLYQLSKGG